MRERARHVSPRGRGACQTPDHVAGGDAALPECSGSITEYLRDTGLVAEGCYIPCLGRSRCGRRHGATHVREGVRGELGAYVKQGLGKEMLYMQKALVGRDGLRARMRHGQNRFKLGSLRGGETAFPHPLGLRGVCGHVSVRAE